MTARLVGSSLRLRDQRRDVQPSELAGDVEVSDGTGSQERPGHMEHAPRGPGPLTVRSATTDSSDPHVTVAFTMTS